MALKCNTDSLRLGVIALVLSGFAFGLTWAGAMASWRLSDELPLASEGIDIVVTGVVATMPQRIERGVRFEFDIDTASSPAPRHVSLGVFAQPDVTPIVPRAGEQWRLTVRLKRPHGNLNPHGRDIEAWLLEQNIRATGYVRSKPAVAHQRLAERIWHPSYLVEAARQAVRDKFLARLPEAPFVGVLIALAIGDQQAIAPEMWQWFSRTGLTHLMSISGSHITMLAALAYLCSAALWRRSSRLPLYLPVEHAGVIGGLLLAIAYGLLAGFAVPAQRTLYMLAVVAGAILARREIASSRVLALALLIVLVTDPWAVLAPGFWLSFGAVAVLLFVARGAARGGWKNVVAAWGRVQWAITLAMLPALLLLFQEFSLVSPVANAVAIPLVGFVIAPLTIAASLPGLSFLLDVAHWLTNLLMTLVRWLAELPFATWQQAAPPTGLVLLALVGALWCLLPRGVPARWIGLLTFIPLLTFISPRPPPNTARITVLDVGQGLAVHVQTAAHDLLSDTGPAYSAEADSGNRIIVPYLRSLGARRLDMLIVSHADRDHSGGAESVLAMLPVHQIKSSLPFEHGLSAQPVPQSDCIAGEAWVWDGVRFRVLHPTADLLPQRANLSTNAMSCVLRIEVGRHALLVTSDIEAEQEQQLLARARDSLAADVLLVPHHGSRTSSTPEFIAAVGAREVIYPVGYRNQFGHPKAAVVSRYFAQGAVAHRTDTDGAVIVDLLPDGVQLSHQRVIDQRYWHQR